MRIKEKYKLEEIFKRFQKEYNKTKIETNNEFPFLSIITLYSDDKPIYEFLVDVDTDCIYGNIFSVDKDSKFIKFLNVLNKKQIKIIV